MALQGPFDDEDPVINPPGGRVPGNTGIAGPPVPPQAASPFDAEKFRKGWAYGGAGFGSRVSLGDLQKYIGSDPGYAGVTLKGEKVYDPSGRYMFDAIGNYTGGDPSGMTRIALQGNSSYQKGKPVAKGKAPVVRAGAGAPAAAGVGGGFNTGGLGAESKGLFDLLMSRAKMSENIDPNDPVIKAQTDAYHAQGTRDRREYLADLAERSGPYANLRGEERMTAERLGQATGGFQAQAMQNELSAKRAQIEHALSGAAGFLTDQQRMALQSELTKLQLAQQESQFGRNLAQQGSQFNRSLSSQEGQFGRSLGQRAYEFDTTRFDNLFA